MHSSSPNPAASPSHRSLVPDLPEVTLCAVDCLNPVLALRALDICLGQCRFADAVFLSDSAENYRLGGCRMANISRITSRGDYSRFVLKELIAHVHTSHVLLVQWDGYVIAPEAWRSEFLEYDYIGAPWGFYNDAHRVGNGGFSLRSTRLLRALQDEEIVNFDPEDEAICRRYRPLLEAKYGIRFAPESVAGHFSFETTYPQGRPFGFHGLFNMWMVLPPEQLRDFVSVLDPSSIAGPQFLQLGKNYLEMGRKNEAGIVLKRRLDVIPGDAVAQSLLNTLEPPTNAGSIAPARATGRNEPCPCKSGKRYKQCCGALAGSGSIKTNLPPVPNSALLLQQAMTHHQSGRLDVAREHYERVLLLEPDNAVATQYLGVLTMQAGDPVQGEVLIRKALVIRSDIPDFHNNLGLCLRLQGRLEEAIASYRQALAINPGYAEAYNNLGLDLQANGALASAIEAFEHALRLQPDFADAHWNFGLALLLRGDFQRGWPEYEWRLRCRAFSADGLLLHGVPSWRGEALAGKTILLHREQGAGDTLQFLRFVPLLHELGARVLLDVPPELSELAATLSPAVEMLDRSRPFPPPDFTCTLMSLPYRLRVPPEAFSKMLPYLRADAQKVAAWRDRLANSAGVRVGLVWAGNPQHSNDRNRSCPLHFLHPLLTMPGVSWFSLQKGAASADAAAAPLTDVAADLHSYADSAALLQALDLLVCVDTSVGHLAGALGRPVWMLLPFAPDWRWQEAREDSPWYPSLRLFRQSAAGDWKGVVTRLGVALRDLTPGAR